MHALGYVTPKVSAGREFNGRLNRGQRAFWLRTLWCCCVAASCSEPRASGVRPPVPAVVPPAPPQRNDQGGAAAAAPGSECGVLSLVETKEAVVSGDVGVKLRLASEPLDERTASEKTVAWEVESNNAEWEPVVELRLDAFTPRRVKATAKSLALGRLVPENTTLSAGTHALSISIVGPDELLLREPASAVKPFDVAYFSVGNGTMLPDAARAPMIVHSQPRGTYNGEEQADHVPLDFHVYNARLGPRAFRVQGSLQGPVCGQFQVDGERALALPPLQSGDYVVRLKLIGPDGDVAKGRFAYVEQTITVNRDAPSLDTHRR